MTEKEMNNEYWIGRFLMIFSFLLILSFFKNDANIHNDSHSISIVQIVDLNNSATISETPSVPNYDLSLEAFIPFDLKTSDSEFILKISDNIITRQFKTEEAKYYQFRPNLLRLQLIHLQFTPPEYYRLIS